MFQKKYLFLVKEINESRVKFSAVITGGGASFLSNFLMVSGASQTVVDGYIPYDSSCLEAFLGEKPDKYVSYQTAIKMAERAYEKGVSKIDPVEYNLVGISCTASLKKDDEREGRLNHAWIAFSFMGETKAIHVVLTQKTRKEQEEFLAEAILEELYVYAFQGIFPINCEQ